MIGLIIIISDGGDEQDGFEILKELKQEICKKLKNKSSIFKKNAKNLNN